MLFLKRHFINKWRHPAVITNEDSHIQFHTWRVMFAAARRLCGVKSRKMRWKLKKDQKVAVKLLNHLKTMDFYTD